MSQSYERFMSMVFGKIPQQQIRGLSVASMTSDSVLAPMIAERSTLTLTLSSSRDGGFRPPSIVYEVGVAHGIVEKTIGTIPVDRH